MLALARVSCLSPAVIGFGLTSALSRTVNLNSQDGFLSLCECLLHKRRKLVLKWHQGWKVTDMEKEGLLTAKSAAPCEVGAGTRGLSEKMWCCLSSGCVPQACEPYLLVSKAFPGSVSVPKPLPFYCGLDPGSPHFCFGCSTGCWTCARDICSQVNRNSGV